MRKHRGRFALRSPSSSGRTRSPTCPARAPAPGGPAPHECRAAATLRPDFRFPRWRTIAGRATSESGGGGEPTKPPPRRRPRARSVSHRDHARYAPGGAAELHRIGSHAPLGGSAYERMFINGDRWRVLCLLTGRATRRGWLTRRAVPPIHHSASSAGALRPRGRFAKPRVSTRQPGCQRKGAAGAEAGRPRTAGPSP